MTQKIGESEGCIVVEGPGRSDREFQCEWLLAAAQALDLWKKAYADPEFEIRIESLSRDVSRRQMTGALTTVIPSEEIDVFVGMCGMGFFRRKGERYRIAIPPKLTIKQVKAAFERPYRQGLL